MILNSYAKLNLFLSVLNLRRDNYHNLDTIFERIDLCDRIKLTPLKNKEIKIISNSSQIPKDSSNFAYRAAKLLQDTFLLDNGVKIEILKRIPVGSGMGGGSSNAATVLIGLNKLWKLNLSKARLAELAGKIGSDAAFFIYNCPFALGQSRGEKITPLKKLNKLRLYHVLVVPKISVSTPMIYRQWDRLVLGKKKNKSRLTMPKANVKILTSVLLKKDLILLGKLLYNGLEPVTRKVFPKLSQIRNKFKELGMKSYLMSGSGPTFFGIVSSEEEAMSLYTRFRQDKNLQVFVAKTRC